MEEHAVQRSAAGSPAGQAAPVAWRDLREWLGLIEAKGLPKRIEAPVGPDEELAATTFMATRRQDELAYLVSGLTLRPAMRQACARVDTPAACALRGW
jgi:hypothetical protein